MCSHNPENNKQNTSIKIRSALFRLSQRQHLHCLHSFQSTAFAFVSAKYWLIIKYIYQFSVYLMLLLDQNLPTELQVCPHPQSHRIGVFWGQNPVELAVSQAKILL